jgi:hypothetical protein
MTNEDLAEEHVEVCCHRPVWDDQHRTTSTARVVLRETADEDRRSK